MKLNINHWATRLLYLFLAADLIFILVHFIYLYTPVNSNDLYSIEKDRGYAEIFQYLKEYWIVLLLGFVAVRQRSLLSLSWSLLFFYILLDDSLKIHESLGRIVYKKLGISAALGLRAIDFGEVIVSASVGVVFFLFIAIAYKFSDRFFRKVSQDLIKMLFILAVFGIVLDLLHVLVAQSLTLESLVGLLEDGGEHIVLSFIAWYTFLLPERLQLETNNSTALESTTRPQDLSENNGVSAGFASSLNRSTQTYPTDD
jgi:hypothetical protein